MGPVLIVSLLIAALFVRIAATSCINDEVFGRNAAARRLLITALGTVCVALIIGVVRFAYFGAWVPRPVAVKVGSVHIELGLRYTLVTLIQSGAIIAVVMAALVLATHRHALTPGWIFGGSLATTGIATVIVPGGDWMEAGRLLAPWLALTMVLVGGVLCRVRLPLRAILIAVLLAANVAGLVNYASRYSTGAAAWTDLVWRDTGSSFDKYTNCTAAPGGWFERHNKLHARDIRFLCHADPVVAALADIVGRRHVSIASGQAGMVVYYLQRAATRRGRPFTFMDELGLTNASWDRCRNGVTATPQGEPVPLRSVLAGRCGPLPDVIIGGSQKRLGARYAVMEAVSGSMHASTWPHGSATGPSELLFVRNDLLVSLRRHLAREQGVRNRVSR
jgi:hypothetical protein